MQAASNNLPELNGFLFEGAAQPVSILIYTSKITPRLQYACKFIFNQGMLVNFAITENENEFLQSKLAKLNYSEKIFDGVINIVPSGLLEEKELKTFVKINNDIFSSVFYRISRYEEWISDKKDNHNRFVPYEIDSSPLVDVWIADLKFQFTAKYNTSQFPLRKFKFISTIDVDNVFAYKAKPAYRQIGGALKDLKNLGSRFSTIFSGAKDPFDEYQLQVELSKKSNVPLIYFFLYRNGNVFDRTIDPNHPEFLKLLAYLKQQNVTIGLHPSYYSTEKADLLSSERNLLSKNSGTDVVASRQHYLRFNIKSTPKQLVKAGIKFDFTMGWSEKIGFRAATTLPFYYYDFESENELPLLAVPFAAMDGAYYDHHSVSANKAFSQLITLANTVKEVNGLFITVIHDRTFSDTVAPGWKDLYVNLHENLKN